MMTVTMPLCGGLQGTTLPWPRPRGSASACTRRCSRRPASSAT